MRSDSLGHFMVEKHSCELVKNDMKDKMHKS